MKNVKMVNLTKFVWKIRFCENWVTILIIWNLVLSVGVAFLATEQIRKIHYEQPPYELMEIELEPIEY